MPADKALPLDRIMHLAEFRARLRAFLRRTEHIAATWELTPQRYLLLLAIEGAPDSSRRLSFTAIAERLQLSRNAVTELCTRAEQAGLVQRRPSDEDARVVYVHLTAEGRKRLYGAAGDNDSERQDLIRAFGELSETFRISTRRRR